ncbi:hypothetical protein TCARB_0171 [Thermofilum adornatum 1505]|uniref:Uncharacterized protein n=1 Tax=Thermofilum adornatum 1505 TaxID=697581 RepID=A0A3G1A7F4_9CREN|nr:hypothetical protein TCARB_0171 [Thermofilum adornatum 1505]
MPFIEMSLQRKVLLVAIGALLSAIPFVYLVFSFEANYWKVSETLGASMLLPL